MENEAKQFLKRVRELEINARQAARAVKSIESDITRLSPALSGMPRGKPPDIADFMDKLTKARERKDAAIKMFTDYKIKCLDYLEQLPNAQHKVILFARFIEYGKNGSIGKYKPLEKIALELNYSLRQTYRLYNAALAAFEKTLIANGEILPR